MNSCRCGCGTQVKGVWARGHASRGPAASVKSLPGPDDPVWDEPAEDFGEIVPDDPPEPRSPGGSSEPADSEPTADDPPPAHGQREWRKKPRSKKPPAKPVRVTAGIRGDVESKLAFMLMVPGQIWAARDPICGRTFVDQVPATADALTEIVCANADLLAFFTGPAGGFMLWLNVGAALMPVFQAVAAHHIYHSVELAAEGEPDPARYAA